MKKINLFAISCIAVLCSCIPKPSNITKEQIKGTWQIENVTYTFDNDTLYIDEIGNEGMGYTYFIEGNMIVAKDDMYPEPFVFEITSLNDSAMSITIYDEMFAENNKFTLNKIK